MVGPSEGNTPGTLQPECVSTQWRRIATLVRQPLCDPADKRGRNFFGRSPVRICQMRSRMREIRTSGSVRGEGGNLLAYSTSAVAAGTESKHGTDSGFRPRETRLR